VSALRCRPLRVALTAVLGGALGLACSNAGESRVLSIQASGIVKAVVYFDRNGNRVADAADTGLTGVRVRLVLRGSRDTVAAGNSLSDGSLRLADVPVGTYTVDVDTTTFGADSFRVTRVDTSLIDVTPGDSFVVRIAISYPQVTVRQARALAAGKKVFVVGVVLNSRLTFSGDDSTTVHLADTSAAVRMIAVSSPIVIARDSVRVLGTRGVDGFGVPVLTNVSIGTLGINAVVTPRSLSAALAADADTGRADGALVRVANLIIHDTATVAGAFRLKVHNGLDTLEVRLDSTAITGFTTPASIAADTLNATICATGLLAPAGTGVWRLKPRSTTDVVAKGTGTCP
jgi:hypothetical protein